MKLLRPSVEILPESMPYESAVEVCGRAAATCYNIPFDGKTFDEKVEFIKKRMKAKHESIIEHATMNVKLKTDRGVLAEITRHRLAAFTVESTRYCNYSADKFDGHVTFCMPPWLKTEDFPEGTYRQIESEEIPATKYEYEVLVDSKNTTWIDSPDPDSKSIKMDEADIHWFDALREAEFRYLQLIHKDKQQPQQARYVLPQGTMTTIYMSANMREWRLIFNLRALHKSGRAHPQMAEIMEDLLAYSYVKYPAFFADQYLEMIEERERNE
jgi:thymidylate synthase (FAD)